MRRQDGLKPALLTAVLPFCRVQLSVCSLLFVSCRVCVRSSDLIPFVLNTTDFDTVISTKDKEVPRAPDTAVPEEVLNRFCEGFEPRPDIVAGQLMSRAANGAAALTHSPARAPWFWVGRPG